MSSHVICLLRAVLAGACRVLDSAISLLTDGETFDTTAKVVASVIILARSDVCIVVYEEGVLATLLCGHADRVLRLMPCQLIRFLGIILSRSRSLLKVHFSLLTDPERLSVLSELLFRAVLAGGNVDILTSSKGAWSSWRGTEVHIRNLVFRHIIGSFRAILTRASSPLKSLHALFSNSERLGVLSEALFMVVLTWSDIHRSILSERVGSRLLGAQIDVLNLLFRHSVGSIWAILTWTSGSFDSIRTLLADFEGLGVLSEVLIMVVLTWSDIHRSILSERVGSRLLGA